MLFIPKYFLFTRECKCSLREHSRVFVHTQKHQYQTGNVHLQQPSECSWLGVFETIPGRQDPTTHHFLWKLWKCLETPSNCAEALSVVLAHGTGTSWQREPPSPSTPPTTEGSCPLLMQESHQLTAQTAVRNCADLGDATTLFTTTKRPNPAKKCQIDGLTKHCLRFD